MESAIVYVVMPLLIYLIILHIQLNISDSKISALDDRLLDLEADMDLYCRVTKKDIERTGKERSATKVGTWKK